MRNQTSSATASPSVSVRLALSGPGAGSLLESEATLDSIARIRRSKNHPDDFTARIEAVIGVEDLLGRIAHIDSEGEQLLAPLEEFGRARNDAIVVFWAYRQDTGGLTMCVGRGGQRWTSR